MIIIYPSPVRDDRTLIASVAGTVLVLNGHAVDLASYDPEAAPCEWIIGTVDREGDDYSVTILSPHGPDAPRAVLWPEPITMTADGPVALPGTAADI